MGERAAVVCLMAFAGLVLTSCDSRASMSVGDVVSAFEAQPGLTVTDPRDVTDERCGAAVPCREALQANEVGIFSFDEKEDAAAFAGTLGSNGYQSDWIVLEYEGAANDWDSARLSYAAIVDGMWSSE